MLLFLFVQTILILGPSHLADIFRRNKRYVADSSVSEMIRHKYTQLPRMSFAEAQVLVAFLILLALWIFRDPKVIPGFGSLFEEGFVANDLH